MSKKHYVAFAESVARIEDSEGRGRVAKLVADVCAQFGGKFDRGRFYWACKVKG
jgi:hypothetical protein